MPGRPASAGNSPEISPLTRFVPGERGVLPGTAITTPRSPVRRTAGCGADGAGVTGDRGQNAGREDDGTPSPERACDARTRCETSDPGQKNGNRPGRGILDKSPNHSVSSPCRLLIEATYAL